MEIKDIRELLKAGIKCIETPKGYKDIINRKNNLDGFDIVNRILIRSQNPSAFDVKSSEEWELDGRYVMGKQTPIFIVIPNIKARYTDTVTGEVIEVKDFTPDELNKAIQLNIIHREDTVDSIYTQALYDIRQTYNMGEAKYSLSKPLIKQSDLLKIAKDILQCNIEQSELNYYSSNNNILYINSSCDFKTTSTYIIDTLTEYFTQYYNNLLSNECKELNIVLSEYDVELLKCTIQYSLDSLFNVDRYIDFDTVRHTNNDKLLLIINISDCIINKITTYLKYSKPKNIDSVRGIMIYRKAEAILDIMESNVLLNKMKGA